VYLTGWHAARMGRAEPGKTVTVIGDGAVGLSAWPSVSASSSPPPRTRARAAGPELPMSEGESKVRVGIGFRAETDASGPASLRR